MLVHIEVSTSVMLSLREYISLAVKEQNKFLVLMPPQHQMLF